MENLGSQKYDHLIAELAIIFRCHFETFYLEDRLYWGIPVLEKQLRRKFRTAEEKSYLSEKARFFERIENTFDENLRLFSQKHLSITKGKDRGLKQHAEDAVKYFQSCGIQISKNFPASLTKLRSQLMHGSLDERQLPMNLERLEAEIRFIYIALHFLELGIPQASMKGLGRYFFEELRSS